MRLQDVVDKVLNSGIKTVLFTGGEPLLDPEIASNFLRAMVENGIEVYVETNGAVDIRPCKMLSNIVMDIKTPSSGMHEKMLWSNLDYIGSNDEIKFVVATKEDYDYAKSIMTKYRLSKKTPNIYFSPVWGEDSTFMQMLSKWLVVDNLPARLGIQQHKVVWGPTRRGV